MKVGSRVRYIHIDREEDKETGYYPPIGTCGTVVKVHRAEKSIRVKWDRGTKNDGIWWCSAEDVEVVSNIEDRIAVYGLMQNYFYDCELHGHSDFEVWCEDNLENDEQNRLFLEIKEHVDAIADILLNI